MGRDKRTNTSEKRVNKIVHHCQFPNKKKKNYITGLLGIGDTVFKLSVLFQLLFLPASIRSGKSARTWFTHLIFFTSTSEQLDTSDPLPWT